MPKPDLGRSRCDELAVSRPQSTSIRWGSAGPRTKILHARDRVELGFGSDGPSSKGYDAASFAASLRAMRVTPHLAQNTSRRPAIDGRTTHVVSQRVRKRIEEAFGWIKTTGGLRKTRHRGTARVGWIFTLTAAACNLVRPPKLLEVT